jgi:predicted nicotinamide N-methyase
MLFFIQFISSVLATDIEEKGILELMEKNIKRNKTLLNGEINVRALNFKSELNKRDDLSNIEVVLAGDVIYDDDITEDFIKFIVNLHNKVTCDTLKYVVALEKRFVFTVDDLDTVAPAHDFFIHQLEHFNVNNKTHKITINYIHLDFPQYFCYERSKDMVMLEIVCELKE